MRENALQAKCITYANSNGCSAWKVETPGRPGFPDVLVIFPGGKVIFVELKTPTGKLRPAQIRTLDKILNLGAAAYVIHTFSHFTALIDERLELGAERGDRARLF